MPNLNESNFDLRVLSSSWKAKSKHKLPQTYFAIMYGLKWNHMRAVIRNNLEGHIETWPKFMVKWLWGVKTNGCRSISHDITLNCWNNTYGKGIYEPRIVRSSCLQLEAAGGGSQTGRTACLFGCSKTPRWPAGILSAPSAASPKSELS